VNSLVIACEPNRLQSAFLSGGQVLARTEIPTATSDMQDSLAAAILGVPRMGGAVPITDAVVAEIGKLIPSAPLHLPQVLAAIAEAGATWPKVPLFLVSDTAFFAGLPVRERTYGLDPTLAARFGERRSGYHGLFHEAACRFVRKTLHSPGPHRIISICLEPKPEAAAVLNGRPVMVTGGATPIEGLPGETVCGDIDPSIVLILAEKLDCGPERINDILTRESGLRSLVGRKVKLGDILRERTRSSSPGDMRKRRATSRPG